MKYTFISGFAQDIQEYIILRQAMGNQEETFSRRLHSFDSYCAEHFPEKTVLTQEICDGWCSLRDGESLATLKLRTGILRDFSKYLHNIFTDSYVIPDGCTGRPKRYHPYIYTDDELSDFFESADTMPPHKLSPCREYVVPVLFRVLYCCGLRPQEVPPLETDDVDLENGVIRISDSKRNKDRIVAMSPDLLALCRDFNRHMVLLIPGRRYFFQCTAGKGCSVRWIQAQFHKCWKRAGKQFSRSSHPRVYDFRHNFATRIIQKWMDEGLDVTCMLPYLSSFMGHESLEYTAYYIHLVPGHLAASGKAEWETGIEVPSYER